MSVLARIRAHGGDVVRTGHRFSLRQGRLTAAHVAWIKARIEDVKREAWPLYDEWEERAAIMEYDGGMSREEAEAKAYEVVTCSQ